MVINIVDKILFGAMLILTLQVPLLADHYLQYISGYFESTKAQVEGYEATAATHQFADVKAMIDTHLKNPEASVRTDAQQKLRTVEEFEALQIAMQIFTTGTIVEKTIYMLRPSHWSTLKKVLPNFKPGLPFSVEYFLYAFVIALLFSAAITALLNLTVNKTVNKRKPKIKVAYA